MPKITGKKIHNVAELAVAEPPTICQRCQKAGKNKGYYFQYLPMTFRSSFSTLFWVQCTLNVLDIDTPIDVLSVLDFWIPFFFFSGSVFSFLSFGPSMVDRKASILSWPIIIHLGCTTRTVRM